MSREHFAIFGKTPEVSVAPETAAAAQEVVRRSQGQALVPWGGGTRQHVGYHPTRYDVALSTEKMGAVSDYSPADLIVSVEAGVTFAQLQAVLAKQGQWLPLDVALPERQTIGGLVAARADSLRRFAFGSVRDSLIGITVVNARGELVKGGGKVVKNVAGYDLPKMYCGSWGTLGLIVEATFKVAPLPETSATVVLPLAAEHNSEDILDSLLASELQPSFVALLNPLAAQNVLDGGPNAQFLFVGFDGSPPDVQWQLQTLALEGSVLTGDTSDIVRGRLRDFPQQDAPMTCKFHILSSQVGAYTRMVEWTACRAGFEARVMADAAVGMVWAHFAPTRDDADWTIFYDDLADKAQRVGGTFIVERMPTELRARDTPVWSPLLSDFLLMRRLKDKIDPTRMWNPGRFVGKI